jgi:hypothetical protein
LFFFIRNWTPLFIRGDAARALHDRVQIGLERAFQVSP